MISISEWDSQKLGVRVGVLDHSGGVQLSLSSGLDSFDLVSCKIPVERIDSIRALEDVGFRFVDVELELEGRADQVPRAACPSDLSIRRVSAEIPNFSIDGFSVEHSRFSLDPHCRARIAPDFWDQMIRSHCEGFADITFVAISPEASAIGVITAFQRGHLLDLFLVAVHPTGQGRGVGSALFGEAARYAADRGLTLSTHVMSGNVRAFNFYLAMGMGVLGGTVVLHRWKPEGICLTK